MNSKRNSMQRLCVARMRTLLACSAALALLFSWPRDLVAATAVQAQRVATLDCISRCQVTGAGFVRQWESIEPRWHNFAFLSWDNAFNKIATWQYIQPVLGERARFVSAANVMLAIQDIDQANQVRSSLRTWTIENGRLVDGPALPAGSYFWARDVEVIGDFLLDRSVIHQETRYSAVRIYADGTMPVTVKNGAFNDDIVFTPVSTPFTEPSHYSRLAGGLVDIQGKRLFRIIIPRGSGPFTSGDVEVIAANHTGVLARSGNLVALGAYDADGDLGNWQPLELPAGFAHETELTLHDGKVFALKRSGSQLIVFKTDIEFPNPPGIKLATGGLEHPRAIFDAVFATQDQGWAIDRTFERVYKYAPKRGWAVEPGRNGAPAAMGHADGLFWVVNKKGNLLLSTDLKTWWAPELPAVSSGAENTIMLSRYDDTVLLLMNWSALYRSKDGGKTFILTELGPRGRYEWETPKPEAAFLVPGQARRGLSMARDGHIYFSDNHGKDWMKSVKLPPHPGNPPKRFVRVGPMAVFSHLGYSFDEGATWQVSEDDGFAWTTAYAFDTQSNIFAIGGKAKLRLYSIDASTSTARMLLNLDQASMDIRSISANPEGGFYLGWVGGFGRLLKRAGAFCIDRITAGGATQLMCGTPGAAERGQQLIKALLEKDLEAARALLSVGAVDIEQKSTDGSTPLLISAMRGYGDIVATLLERGAVIEAIDQAGATALILAAASGHLEVVRALVAKGANVNAQVQGRTALGLARAWKRTEVVQFLEVNGAY